MRDAGGDVTKELLDSAYGIDTSVWDEGDRAHLKSGSYLRILHIDMPLTTKLMVMLTIPKRHEV